MYISRLFIVQYVRNVLPFSKPCVPTWGIDVERVGRFLFTSVQIFSDYTATPKLDSDNCALLSKSQY